MKDVFFKPPNMFRDDDEPRMIGAFDEASDERRPSVSSHLANNPFHSRNLSYNTNDDEDDLYVKDSKNPFLKDIKPPQIPSLTSPSAESAPPLSPDGEVSTPFVLDEQTGKRVTFDASVDNEETSKMGSQKGLDLVNHMHGMYRLLDLISEQGSGGLVDKVIIAQEYVSRLINALSPGAYRDLTKVDFASMDRVQVKPLGIYGTKQEIVRFLRQLDVVDRTMEKLLLATHDAMTSATQPHLSPGLYALTLESGLGAQKLFVIFWPEDTTWDDDAVSTVRRNRITFMRYLTKITDQIAVFISKEHCAKLVWSDKPEKNEFNPFDEEESDRLFSFEVKKANEQEEDVKLREGFLFRSPHVVDYKPPADVEIDANRFHCRLVVGECRQGIMTVEYKPATDVTKTIAEEFSTVRLKSALVDPTVSIQLGSSLPDDAIARLAKLGLKSVYTDQIEAWERRAGNIGLDIKKIKASKEAQATKAMKADSDNVELALEFYLLTRVLKHYPNLDVTMLRASKSDSAEEQVEQEVFLKQLFSLYPAIRQEVDVRVPSDTFTKVEAKLGPYTKAKRTVASFMYITQRYRMSDNEKAELLKYIENEDIRSQVQLLEREENEEVPISGVMDSIWNAAGSAAAYVFGSNQDSPARRAVTFARNISDRRYVEQLDIAVQVEPLIAPHAERSMTYLYENLSQEIKRRLKKVIPQVEFIQQRTRHEAINRELLIEEEKMKRASREILLEELQAVYKPDEECNHIVTILELGQQYYGYHSTADYRILANHRTKTGPRLCYTLYPLSLTEHDQHIMKMESKHVPHPNVSERFKTSFNLPPEYVITHFQPLECGKALLILDLQGESLYVFLEDPARLDGVVRERKYKKRILREKLGGDVVAAYDEQKRLLVVCGVDAEKSTIQLHSFVFDENYAQLQGQGSTVNLRPWYTEVPKLQNMLFVSGTDELAFVENSGNVRIFSLVTQMFRPASLQLDERPAATYSTPDGSCLIAFFHRDRQLLMRAYHWTSFGSHDGFGFEIPMPVDAPVLVTSFGQRNSVHLVTIDPSTHSCCSLVMDITRQVTEFQFREKTSRRSAKVEKKTFHNSLIDCHSEVWTRFPVIPAVHRQTITADGSRKGKYLLFVATNNHDNFEPYFKSMIQKFHKGTKKPIGSVLSDLAIFSRNFTSALTGIKTGTAWNSISTFKSGEWMVDLFCLIPIHIAIARENRFIPLKDGVWAPEAEKALLGAEMGRIVDSLSFGWYESIFQSYMSMKPVKVVSSMGEQSVGKSFALNHLVDTSFAGSAMRTTEGVWMSVAPTDSHLIVALDFEGVHSIERSAQEDTLLVLFNAAISNLVLFRNNFALSRDITNLFQSFQSSSTVLDPEANPTLFQSTLVVIIKDVVDSDRDEIAREFRLKLQSIVEQEQANNFITRLHRGHLKIVPWPVIESRQFYTLFHSLRKFLDKDSASHEAAGVFLHKLKMLMAKLKINDWGSLSQNLASHRAQYLLQLLPIALAFGATEIEPEFEPLKNVDTDLEVPHMDSTAAFWVNKVHAYSSKLSKEDALRDVCHSWPNYNNRLTIPDNEWTEMLSQYVNDLVTHRVDHVQAWVDSNLAKFGKSNAAMEELSRTMDAEVVEMRRAVQLCKIQCNQCHLLCLDARFHEGPHNCSTDHLCKWNCQFEDAHVDGPETCSLPAGHSGEHICDVIPHLCGAPCSLQTRRGCQGTCTKVANHTDGQHMCSARKHACGEPCGLRRASTVQGSFTCTGTCVISWNDEHEIHVCEASMSCPIQCQLCKRLCATPNHLHGLKEGESHLCGQEHKCQSLCAAIGACEIDTVPHSIEATFSGKHDRFQYTKYSQVTKRLPCVVPITPGELSHLGPHRHGTTDDLFHFCEARCGSCGYLCTLKQGHPQAEHFTNHGSMSRTQWAVDGPDGTVFELDGHKFGSSDDGAPMMCNMVCRNMGRHLHIDYCRAAGANQCNQPETLHITERMVPNPDQPKDWITHSLFWRRLGFKDPYSKDEQTNFAKCDAMCPGPEHEAAPNKPAQPSYCTLPMFHAPQANTRKLIGGVVGYVSNDGHHFTCKNPTVLQQAFHVIFVIDRSGSMSGGDRRPLPDHPSTARIVRTANNRLGAVYQAMYSFWTARAQALDRSAGNNRRDAYSAILFESIPMRVFTNDFTSSPDDLLNRFLTYSSTGGTNFDGALRTTQQVMDECWSTERMPVVIFLSDGECSVSDNVMYAICRRAVALGKPLSFHAVSFGPDGSSTSLRRMVQIANEIQVNAPPDPFLPANAIIESSYTVAIDTIRLAETFLGLAESLRKPRASLLRT